MVTQQMPTVFALDEGQPARGSSWIFPPEGKVDVFVVADSADVDLRLSPALKVHPLHGSDRDGTGRCPNIVVEKLRDVRRMLDPAHNEVIAKAKVEIGESRKYRNAGTDGDQKWASGGHIGGQARRPEQTQELPPSA